MNKEKTKNFVKQIKQEVFCVDCIYVYLGEYNYECHCPKLQKIEKTPIRIYRNIIRCEEANKNNDCPYFEEKITFFERLKKWLFKEKTQ